MSEMPEMPEMPSREELGKTMQQLGEDLADALDRAQKKRIAGEQLDVTYELAENVYPLLARVADLAGVQPAIAGMLVQEGLSEFADSVEELIEEKVAEATGDEEEGDQLTPETALALKDVVKKLLGGCDSGVGIPTEFVAAANTALKIIDDITLEEDEDPEETADANADADAAPPAVEVQND